MIVLPFAGPLDTDTRKLAEPHDRAFNGYPV
jgi:hypothetical protein